MGEFVDRVGDLKPGEQVVITVTGVADIIYGHGFRVETAGDDWTVDQKSIDNGTASIERIELNETKRLEPGVYEVDGRPEVYYIVSKTGKVTYVNTVVNVCRPYPSEDDFRTAYSQGLFRRVS